MYPKLISKSIENGGSGTSFLGAGGYVLEPFWNSGRVPAPKCVLGGVLGGSWAILGTKMAPTWGPRWLQVGAKMV